MDWNYLCQNRGLRLCIVIIGVLILIISLITIILIHNSGEDLTPLEKAEKFLSEVLLFDGHNDFVTNVRRIVQNDLSLFNFSSNLSESKYFRTDWFSHTDLYRLRAGRVKAQFWVVRAGCKSQFKDAVEIILEQIDVIKRLASNYSSEMSLVKSYDELMAAVEENKIASFITICCGHAIQYSFAILRLYYELGVRAMTLVPADCPTPWGDSAAVDRPNGSLRHRAYSTGLSDFGKEVIFEMNRLGMIVDISESSSGAMTEALISSKAPVIFSHAAARSLCKNEENIPDNILKLVRQKDALIMITFDPTVLKCNGSTVGVTIADVIEHIEYLRDKTTIENVGIGSNFDAVEEITEGLEDVSKFPNLFAALIETGWTHSDLEKLAGQNMVRVLQEVEAVRDKMQDLAPTQSWINFRDLKKIGFDGSCESARLAEPSPQYNTGQQFF